MKLISFLLIFLFGNHVLFDAHASVEPKVKLKKKLVFSSVHYCPLICDDPNKPGIMVDITKEIFKKHNIDIEVKFVTLPRAIILASDGEADGLIGGDKYQAPNLIFPKTIMINHYVKFISLANSTWKFSDMKSLEKVRLGVVDGYGYANVDIDSYIKDNKKVIRIKQKLGSEHLLSLLLLKRIDTFPEGHLVAKYLLSKEKKLKEVKLDKTRIGRFKNYISFSPKLTHVNFYKEIVDRELPKLRKNGFYQKVLAKYNIEDSDY